MPALFTRMSRRPNAACSASTAASTAAASVMSTSRHVTRRRRRLQRLGRGLEPVGGEVPETDRRTGRQEQPGDGAAEPSRTAGDDRGLARKVVGVHVGPRVLTMAPSKPNMETVSKLEFVSISSSIPMSTTAVDRCLTIVEALVDESAGVSLVDLAARLEMPTAPSTARSPRWPRAAMSGRTPRRRPMPSRSGSRRWGFGCSARATCRTPASWCCSVSPRRPENTAAWRSSTAAA